MTERERRIAEIIRDECAPACTLDYPPIVEATQRIAALLRDPEPGECAHNNNADQVVWLLEFIRERHSESWADAVMGCPQVAPREAEGEPRSALADRWEAEAREHPNRDIADVLLLCAIELRNCLGSPAPAGGEELRERIARELWVLQGIANIDHAPGTAADARAMWDEPRTDPEGKAEYRRAADRYPALLSSPPAGEAA